MLRQGVSQARQLKKGHARLRAASSRGCAFRLPIVKTPAKWRNSPEANVRASAVDACATKSAN